MAGISSDIIRGYNDTMILYLLLDKPSYGYEISKQIKALSNEKYIMKETTLYSAFTRMEKNGWVTLKLLTAILKRLTQRLIWVTANLITAHISQQLLM